MIRSMDSAADLPDTPPTEASRYSAEAGQPGGAAPADRSALDRWIAEIRFHHLFNLIIFGLIAALALTVPELTLLPLYLALVARVPSLQLQRRYGFSPMQAALAIAAGAFLTLAATGLALVLPVLLQAASIDAAALEGVRPTADRLTAWANTVLASLGVAPEDVGLEGGLTTDDVVRRLAGSVGESYSVVLQGAGVLLQPFIFAGLSLLIVFMAAYALASSDKLKQETRRFLRICWPARTVAIVERLTLHAQHFGAEVFRGYCWMVLVLGVFYFLVYLGAVALFTSAQNLPPITVVALLILSAVIGAVPGLGAKILLLIGAVAGLLIGVVATLFTGDLWLGVYIFAAVTVVTGFESKFGTPSTMGRALGVNSCLILFLAIAMVAGFGVGPTLWTIFVILPMLVAAMRVMVELHGDTDLAAQADAPIPALGEAPASAPHVTREAAE
ncbi:MAG: hypothetical protein AAF909_00040 [Pseudomonadota bacterium]